MAVISVPTASHIEIRLYHVETADVNILSEDTSTMLRLGRITVLNLYFLRNDVSLG